ncbi:hypothetical protein [Microbacterium aurantiacum]|uniref:hypothetical protein n=1 Tax=Microbacterium aurantiacum TaxID=162393 RepID=UPI00342C41C0
MSTEDRTPKDELPPRPPLPVEPSHEASDPLASQAELAETRDSTPDEPSPAARFGFATPANSSRRRNIFIGAGVAAVLVVGGGIAGIVALASQPTPLERAGETCAGTAPLATLLDDDGEPLLEDDGTLDEYFDGVVTIEDGGSTLIVSTLPQDDDPLGISTTSLSCVQEELGMPTWLTESISQTRSLDGRQSEEWDGFSGQWSYHPDNGLNLIIVQR